MSEEQAPSRKAAPVAAPEHGTEDLDELTGELEAFDRAPEGLGGVVEEPAADVRRDELAELAAQRDEYLALAQRTQADFENYRKRVAREASSAELRGVGRLARELLPALDSIDRAIDHASTEGTEQMLEGLRLVQRELRGALERVGIEAFGETGERFDPGQHEAVAQQPRDGIEVGAIVEVFQVGYRTADGGILRPARVMVAG